MFGYLQPLVPELKVWEAQLYRACYCGVCRAIARQCGQLPRLSLQYDAAVLALLWMGEKPSIPMEKRACILHPGVPQPIVKDDPALDAAAQACILLACWKAGDALRDEGGPKAWGAQAVLAPAVKRMARQNAAVRAAWEAIAAMVEEIHRLEAACCGDMDAMAEWSGKIVAAILRMGPGLSEDTKRTLDWMGLQLGRWLFLVDALDDMDRDAASGAYNVLHCMPGTPQEVRTLAGETAQWAAMQAANAFALFPEEGQAHGILYNLFYAGMPSTLDRVLHHPQAAKSGKAKE